MDIKAIDLRHLHYFVAVAEEMSFSRAAQRLNMAQPPLSQQIKQLEEQIGAQLFDRTLRQITLTLTGKSLLPRARKMLADFSDTLAYTRRVAKGGHGQLNIGIIGSAPYNPDVAALLGRFSRLHPNIDISLQPHTSGTQIELLRKGELDIGIHWPLQERQHDGIRSEILSKGELTLALSAHDARGKKKIADLALFEKETWLHAPHKYAYSMALYERTTRLWQAAGIQPQKIMEVSEVPAMLLLIAAGQGVSLLPDFMQDAVKGVRFVPLPPKYRKMTAYTMLLSRRASNGDALIDLFFKAAAASS